MEIQRHVNFKAIEQWIASHDNGLIKLCMDAQISYGMAAQLKSGTYPHFPDRHRRRAICKALNKTEDEVFPVVHK